MTKEDIKNTHDIDTNKLIKQAKIDVLNELKEKQSIAIWDIDELIKEIENADKD